MSESNPSPSKTRRLLFYIPLLLLTAAATVAVMLLLQNIFTRQREAEQVSFSLVKLDEKTIDPKVWGENFPKQLDGYTRTMDTTRTRWGGSEAEPQSKLDADPRWRVLFEGYAFAVDYRDRRGHAYMLRDQDMTKRVQAPFKQPGACLQCHSSIIPTYRELGAKAGVAATPGDNFQWPQVMKGFEQVCAMSYPEARKLVDHPVSCIDCHDPQTMHLRVTRPGFMNGIRALAKSDAPVPHLPSIERWRKGDRAEEYDPNTDATRQEMRSFVCGQCHVEYYFKGDGKLLTYPWFNGLKVEQIEKYYDEQKFTDWKHTRTGSPLLKAQHPEFETWSQGIHARSGVSCADCHMPYMREGAVKISDHHIRSPMLMINRARQTCHRFPELEMKSRILAIQDRHHELLLRAEDATLQMIDAIVAAKQAGATDAELAEARDNHRKAEWRLDFISAENSMGFHASQESARILGEAIDYARLGQVAAIHAKPTSAQPAIQATQPANPSAPAVTTTRPD